MYFFRSISNQKFTTNYQIIFRSFSQLHRNQLLLNTRCNKKKLFTKTNQNDISHSRLLSDGAEDQNRRLFSELSEKRKRNRDIAIYGVTFVLMSLALSYAAVPLYRIYCQATGKGGKAKIADDFLANKVKKMKKKKEKLINVVFTADKQARMTWNFKPTQNEIKVYPGETALAFFTAKNPTNRPVNGVSTYSVAPVEAGLYLNKIQCFCFEEQRLEPGEEVDMPVFFYFDPEFADDPKLENVNEVSLSYTFFEAKEGFKMPTLPSFKLKSTTNTVQAAVA